VIRSLHWDEVPGAGAKWLADPAGRLLALIPGPADHDVCLQDAGFGDFADSDEAWQAEFSSLVAAVLDWAAPYGQARLASGAYPVWRNALGRLAGRREEPTIVDAVVRAALDDAFAPCSVEFGDPVRVVVRTADAHPIVWVWELSPEQASETLVIMLASGRQTQRTRLEWRGLL